MTDEQNIAYKGEAQLLDWGDSRTSGPYIKLQLPDTMDLEKFRTATTKKKGMAGQLYAVMIVELDYDQDAAKPATTVGSEPRRSVSGGEHGRFYMPLFRDGWVNNPAVLQAIGSDDDYNDYVSRLPSIISGGYNEVDDFGDARCVPCHVRRVSGGAGTAIKPPYATVPMTNDEHMLQHREGESIYGGKEFFDKKLVEIRANWVRAYFYRIFNVDSFSKIPPANFIFHCRELGIEHTLPRDMQ